MLRIDSLHKAAERAAQFVVLGAESVIAAVRRTNRLADYVSQHPTLARFHACLVNARAEHVVVIAHDDAIFRVDHRTLIASMSTTTRVRWNSSMGGSPGVELLYLNL